MLRVRAQRRRACWHRRRQHAPAAGNSSGWGALGGGGRGSRPPAGPPPGHRCWCLATAPGCPQPHAPLLQIFRDGRADAPQEYQGPRDTAGIVRYLSKQARHGGLRVGGVNVCARVRARARVCVYVRWVGVV